MPSFLAVVSHAGVVAMVQLLEHSVRALALLGGRFRARMLLMCANSSRTAAPCLSDIQRAKQALGESLRVEHVFSRPADVGDHDERELGGGVRHSRLDARQLAGALPPWIVTAEHSISGGTPGGEVPSSVPEALRPLDCSQFWGLMAPPEASGGTRVIVCGPPAFNSQVAQSLQQLGVPASCVEVLRST